LGLVSPLGKNTNTKQDELPSDRATQSGESGRSPLKRKKEGAGDRPPECQGTAGEAGRSHPTDIEDKGRRSPADSNTQLGSRLAVLDKKEQPARVSLAPSPEEKEITARESPCRPRKRRREGRTIMQSIHDRPGRSLSLAFEEQPAWAGRWCLAPAKGPSGRLYAPQRAPGRRAG
jgi:hypothetical protein